MLAEDNQDQRDLILRSFKNQMPEAFIDVIREGRSIAGKMSETRYDILILDFSLPLMNGLEVLTALQAEKNIVPVIMVTGQGDEKIAVEAMKNGASDYIIKSGKYYDNLPRIVETTIVQFHLKQKAEKSSLKLKVLHEISLSMTRERNEESLGDIIASGAVTLMETEGAAMFLIEPRTRGITLSSFSGVHLADKHPPALIDSLGLFGESFITRSTFLDDAPRKHVLFGNTPAFDRQVDRLLSVPIALQGVISGTLTVVNKKNREPFTEEEVTALQTLALQAGAAIDNARFIQEKEKQAVTDGLTGIYNRVEFHKRISIEYERSLRNRSDFSILLIDIDFFKRINDSYGHPAGDVVLKDVVKIIQNCIRNFDFMARYGGEEFIVILPETDGIRAALVADRIRGSVEDHSFIIPSGETEHLTISAGIASFPLDSATAEDIITASDDALYFCKNSGRNRIARFSEIAKIK